MQGSAVGPPPCNIIAHVSRTPYGANTWRRIYATRSMPVGRLGTNDPGMNPPVASPSDHLIITQAPHGHPRGRRAPSAIRRRGNPSARAWPRTSAPLEKHESGRFGFPPWEASPLGDPAPGDPSARGWPRTSEPLEKHESGRLQSLRNKQAASCTDSTDPAFPCRGNRCLSRACPSTAQALPASVRGS